MLSRVSILDEIRSGTYEAGIITTYSVFFPFYETVVLPKLVAAGCRHNVVLVDANECARAVRDDRAQPQLAGKHYALLPIRVSGAFHPKLILLVGPKSGKLFVGSHNLTVSGYGHNRELTNHFDIEPKSDPTSTLVARYAFSLLRTWTGSLPLEARKAIDRVSGFAPWLSGELPEKDDQLLGSISSGPALWEIVKANVRGPIRRALVLGAFFDSSLKFVRTIQRELRPRQLVVALDPDTTDVTPKARSLVPEARFVDAGELAGGTGYLHAKVLIVESQRGEEVFVSGSANPSFPAWLAKPKDRNIEAVVIQKGNRRNSPSANLGLKDLFSKPPLGKSAWEQVAERRRKKVPASNGPPGTVVMAFVTKTGFRISWRDLPGSPLREVTALLGPAKSMPIPGPYKARGEWLEIKVPSWDMKTSAMLLSLRHRSGAVTYGVPYDEAALTSRSQTDSQKALRQAIASLDTEAPELESLLRLVEKVIFDEATIPEIGSPQTARHTKGRKADSADVPTSLAADLQNEQDRQSRRRYLITDNLVLLLDVLIHRLGQGLEAGRDGRDSVRPGEEELIGQDTELTEPPAEVDGERLAALCRRRVKTLLLRRLAPQLKLAARDEKWAVSAIFQTAAVLALIKTLATIERTAPWVPKWEKLIDPECQAQFLSEAAGMLCFPGTGLLERGPHVKGKVYLEEVSTSLGILMWFGWIAGIDRRSVDLNEDREELRNKMLALADLMFVVVALTRDHAAIESAKDVIGRTCESRHLSQTMAWLDYHLKWARKIATVQKRPTSVAVVQREAVAGDVVLIKRDPTAPPMLVVDAWPERVSVADPRKDDGWRTLESSYVSIVDLSKLPD